MTDNKKREIPKFLENILESDRVLTKQVFDAFDKKYGYEKYKQHLKGLEYSCHGLPWLGGCFSMLYLGYSQYLWLNMLLLQVVDIIFVATVKAFTRRRRPTVNQGSEMFLTIGADKFSFPSGHASRAMAVTFFFLWLYPVNILFQLLIVAWSVAVAVSRVFLGRHHVLDVVGGVVFAVLEYQVTSFLWLSPESAQSWGKYLSLTEDPWSSG